MIIWAVVGICGSLIFTRTCMNIHAIETHNLHTGVAVLGWGGQEREGRREAQMGWREWIHPLSSETVAREWEEPGEEGRVGVWRVWGGGGKWSLPFLHHQQSLPGQQLIPHPPFPTRMCWEQGF